MINNQHSDGIYVDAPQPIGTYYLDKEHYSITSYHFVNHSVEDFGDEYDHYIVEFYVDNFSEEGIFHAGTLMQSCACCDLIQMAGAVFFPKPIFFPKLIFFHDIHPLTPARLLMPARRPVPWSMHPLPPR